MAGISGLAIFSKMSQVGEVLGGANELRDDETMIMSRTAMPRPMGMLSSAAVFGSFSLLLWMAVAFEIPWLHHAFGIPPIFGWYMSGTAFVLFPILLFGVAMAWRELPTRNLRLLRERLRLGRLSSRDTIWAICSLIGIAFMSAIIAELALRVNPDLRVSPEFLLQSPGRHVLVFAAWIPLFVTNILGEELCWRGYVLPRQEAAWGRAAWLLNGTMWCLFHWSFGWPIMMLLLPIALLLPWVVERRQNTSVGILIHAIFNAAGFIAVISGRANL
jgi:membrane protease YdiL (CAAX protease family)